MQNNPEDLSCGECFFSDIELPDSNAEGHRAKKKCCKKYKKNKRCKRCPKKP